MKYRRAVPNTFEKLRHVEVSVYFYNETVKYCLYSDKEASPLSLKTGPNVAIRFIRNN